MSTASSADALFFVNTVFTGLSALGTISAVIVSLYLAFESRRPQISVRCSIEYILDSHDPSDKLYVIVMATNRGVHVERVEMHGYFIGLFWLRRSSIVKPGIFPGMKGFPSQLDPTEKALEVISLDDFDKQQLLFFVSFFESLGLPRYIKKSRIFVRMVMLTARVWVSTTRGGSVTARIDSTLRRHIENLLLFGEDTQFHN